MSELAKNQNSLLVHLKDEFATEQIAKDIAMALKGGLLIFLEGDLGAGKTTLARALIRHIFEDTLLEVPSPTYSLVHTYNEPNKFGISNLLHSDLYRISEPQEIEELGLLDKADDQTIIVEWPNKAEGLLGEPDLSLTLTENGAENSSGNGRDLKISGALATTVKRSLLIRDFIEASKTPNWQADINTGFEREKLFGDASSRSYEKISNGSETRILMNAPRQADGPAIKDGKPYSQLAHLAEDVSAFVGVANILQNAGLATPQIYAQNLSEGLLLLEDLGTGTIITKDRKPIANRYEQSVQMLAHFHERAFEKNMQLQDGNQYVVPQYSRQAMLIETELLLEWYAPRMKGAPLKDDEKAAYFEIWNALIDKLEASEQALILRDYHSPNIIWLEDRPNPVGVIDFQDAVIGPSAYDVASIVQDARIDMSEDLENSLIDAYIKSRTVKEFDKEAFEQDYAIMAAQRASKILGIFVRLDERDGKPNYLAHLPRMQDYIVRSLKHPALAAYKKWYSTVIGM
ncbi:MAG: tRNA (adenosine(37)-N6)-threonylcarbamoyltransferase complex ATPase subunit type 1 TsaE [Nitratireductor sp.]